MDTMEELIKQASDERAEKLKKLINNFKQEYLDTREELLDLATPTDGSTDLLFITDRRVFFFRNMSESETTPQVLEYSQIKKVSLECDEEKADMRIENNQEDVMMEKVFLPVAEKVKESIDYRLTE